MGIAYYLFDQPSREYLYLGEKVSSLDRLYQGPTVFIDGSPYRLPPSMLDILIERFSKNRNVIFISGNELFDNEDFWDDKDDLGVSVGGDRDFDVPLAIYLPELNDPEVVTLIKSYSPPT
jgi:hypothetical protein